VVLGQGTQVEFAEQVGDAAEGIMIHSAWHAAVQWKGELGGKPFTNQDFVQAWNERFGRDPDEDEAIPFATCQGMDQAIRASGSTDNDVLRDWLASRSAEEPVKTILGDFYWDERGLPLGKPFLITQWQDQELKFVYPVDQFPGTSPLLWK
jgi:branched-chain amino acid transport system substrate-binding protein